MPSSDQDPDRPGNPSDAYPPTRPGPVVVALAVVAVLIVVGAENWSDIASHVPQIEKAIGF